MRGTVVDCILFGTLLSGLDLSSHSIPLAEIKSCGPPGDGIPALTDPAFVSGKTAEEEFSNGADRVLGLHFKGKAKAYPVKTLNWGEVVDDKLTGKNMHIHRSTIRRCYNSGNLRVKTCNTGISHE
ncbi:MAG: DUF3179 domain-containing protein [Candidatus Nitronauta litoralis]|uniref:DUF3179 domain-containing protein n=1 Tax=Candidatus Nitronauta litoralis TaxID=2705533 RepID=A0A7T0BWP3_9BACT|nr:MAG: DUF3179 domain-containing protein [Candidatus Nitronauta litoralis]